MVTGFALLDNLKGKKIRAYEILKKFSINSYDIWQQYYFGISVCGQPWVHTNSLSLSLSLSIRYNKLTELTDSLCDCTQLEEISLESNNLSTLPVSADVTMATTCVS